MVCIPCYVFDVCLVISTLMCREYVELYSVQKNWKKKMKRLNFINLFSLLDDENNFLS